MFNVKMPLVASILFICSVAVHAEAQQKPAQLRQLIVGTWLLSEQWVERDGTKIHRFGTNPKGLAMYDSGGRFSTILLRNDLPRFASNNAMTGTPEENRAIVQGTNATFGTWSVDEQDGALVSNIEGSTFPGWDGQRQRRTLSILGDELKMCVAGAQIGGTACAIWRRAK